MDNSKLVSLLKTFNSKELREFGDFLASPFFNKNEELSILYAQLKKIAPAFPPAKIKREIVYANAFPGKIHDEKHLNYLMSFTLKAAERYLGIQNFLQKEPLHDYHMLEAFIKRGLDKHYSHIYKKALARLESNPLRDTEYHYQQFLMADIDNLYFHKQMVRKSDRRLQQASDHFDQYYLVKKLQYTCEMLDREQIISTEFRHQLSKEIGQFLAKKDFNDIPAIAIYYRIFLALSDQEADKNFQELKQLLDLHFDKFATSEINLIMMLSLNFCIRKIRHHKEQYVQEALDIYMKGIKSEVLFDKGYLSPWTFKNVVKLGLRSKRYDWVEQFIHNHVNSVAPEFRSNALHYNLADLQYYKKEFSNAQENLSKVEFSDIFYALHSKVMLLKIYFETNEWEALQALIASFRLFLQRNKVISDNVRTTYLNFTNFLAQIARLREKPREDILEKIKETQFVTDREWLLEKVAAVALP